MKACNYDKLMEAEIKNIPQGEKPRLLLHACCAPCSSSCIERLKEFFDITVYYYNPNIDGESEYVRRAEEQKRLCEIDGVSYACEKYVPSEFYEKVKGKEDLPEGGERCFICYALRLDKTAEYAKENGYDYFTTTLTVSPLKNADKLNEIGAAAGEKYGVKFLPSDFKKRNGYLRSVQLSKEYGLYRQNYCGCVFSKNKTP